MSCRECVRLKNRHRRKGKKYMSEQMEDYGLGSRRESNQEGLGPKITSDKVTKNKYVKLKKESHEDILGSSGVAPSILNLGIRWS